MKRIELLIVQDHKIGKLIVNDVIEIAKITTQERREKNHKEKILLSPRQYYVSQLMYPCFEIENKFNDFDQISHLLSKYPQGKEFRANHTKERYILFILEIYFISQIALFDRILHLTNFVFELGLNDVHVKYEIISKNTKIDKNFNKILKKLYDHLQKNNTRSLQNKIKHKERLRDDELYAPSVFEQVIKLRLFNGFNEKEIKDLKEEMQLGYKVYINKKRKLITKETTDLKELTVEILDFLYPLILRKHRSYNEK